MNDTPDHDDELPVLTDVVQPGRTAQTPQEEEQDTPPPALSAEEIEAIARRVVERYTTAMEEAVARAIRSGLEHRRKRTRAAAQAGADKGEEET